MNLREIGDLSDRIFAVNEQSPLASGAYILVVLNRALRGEDNPVIDAALVQGDRLDLSIIVYSELDETAFHASDRLFYFVLGAFRELAETLATKGIKCVQVLKKAGDADLLQPLATKAAVIYTDEDYTYSDRKKLERVLKVATQTVFLVDAARIVPTRQLPKNLKTTPEFRKAHSALRKHYIELRQEVSQSKITVVENRVDLPIEHNFAEYSDAALIELIENCDIDHATEISQKHPPTQAEITARINTLKTEILAKYKWNRNNAALKHSTSKLSPYLHFGMLGPHQVLNEVESSEIPKTYTYKFRDEFLTWREWSHYQAFHQPKLHEYDSLPDKAKQTLAEHKDDERPDLRTFAEIMSGNTGDRTWNALQKEWLNTGWLHNNLRMYWAKQILRFTKTPQEAWNTACYINNHISLDGRDPATYASMRWAFGDGKPGYSEKPIYGWVAPKSDRAILKREGMKEWISRR